MVAAALVPTPASLAFAAALGSDSGEPGFHGGSGPDRVWLQRRPCSAAFGAADALDLAVLWHPGAVVRAGEVLEESGRLGLHDAGDRVEHQAQLLLGARGGTHLDHVPQCARV